MSVSTKDIRIIRYDHDGNLYSIPENLLNSFTYMNEDLMSVEPGSSDWFDMKGEFESIFGEYLRS